MADMNDNQTQLIDNIASEGRMEKGTIEQVQQKMEKMELEKGAVATHTSDAEQRGLRLPMEIILQIVRMVMSDEPIDDLGLDHCHPADFASLRLVSHALFFETHSDMEKFRCSSKFSSKVAMHLLSIWTQDKGTARNLIDATTALPLAGRIQIDYEKTKRVPSAALNYVLARCVHTIWLALVRPRANWLTNLDATRLCILDLNEISTVKGGSALALPNFAECRQLEHLRIHLAPKTLFELDPAFRWPPALERLAIDGEMETTVDLKLEQCFSLVSLVIPDSAVSAVDRLGKPSTLERLYMWQGEEWPGHRDAFTGLPRLHGLRELSLPANGLLDFIEVPLAQLKSVQRFNVPGGCLKSLRGLDLCSMPQLHTVTLDGLRSPSWRSALQGFRSTLEVSNTLQFLSIRRAVLEDSDLEDFNLCRCTSLKVLDIGHNFQISLAGLQHLDLSSDRSFTLIVDHCKVSPEETATLSLDALQVCASAEDTWELQRPFRTKDDFTGWFW